MNSEVYLDLLKEKVIPNLRERFGTNFILQNHAPPHVAKKVKEFLAENEINLLRWPSRSPDLSIIENVWRVMKCDVYENYEVKNFDNLSSRIQLAQVKINSRSDDVVKSLYSSMIKRYLNVLKNNGCNRLVKC